MKHLLFAFLLISSSVSAEPEVKKELRAKLQEIAKQHQLVGENVVVIAVPESDMASLFPDDPKKRVKVEAKVVISDGENVFNGKISPGGQSTLTAGTPNLRVKKLKQKVGEGDALVGVQNIDGTTRINPLTMDEGYVSTKFYQRSLNHFGLTPSQAPLKAEYSKVVYVPMTESGELVPTKAKNAGLHLVNNHPVKLLANASTDEVAIEAVGRSRYNVVNVQEKLKLKKPDPETVTFSSLNAEKKATPFRVDLSWSSGDEATKQLQTMLNDLYAAPLKYKGPELYREMSKLMDTDQMFRFLALNAIMKNGDISDEYFWYTQKDRATGQVKLRIMPQDGDDLLKGAHMFPFDKKQIGLIARDKLGKSKDFIFNYEDPLFRTIKNDPHLYQEYLKTYGSVAYEVGHTNFLDKALGGIEQEVNKFTADPEVLNRGAKDEIARPYEKGDFSKRATVLRDQIKANAKESLEYLGKTEMPKAHNQVLKLRVACLKTSLKALAKNP